MDELKPRKQDFLKYIPSFCWQTTSEILSMFEQLEEHQDIDYFTVKTLLNRYKKEGYLIARETGAFRYKGGHVYEYRRK